MSYTVEYNPELRNSYPMKQKKRQKIPVKTFVVAFIIVVALYIFDAVGFLQYIIPGDPTVTAGAFYDMVEQVRAGQTVSEGILTFFKDVITGGMYP